MQEEEQQRGLVQFVGEGDGTSRSGKHEAARRGLIDEDEQRKSNSSEEGGVICAGRGTAVRICAVCQG